MKNVSLEGTHLIVKGTAKGTVVSAFALISFILFLVVFSSPIGYFFLVSGIVLFIISILVYVINEKKIYFEINENILIFSPFGSYKIRYEIPLSRIIFFTHLIRQRGRNNRVLSVILNNESEKSMWINGKYEEEVTKHEIDLDHLPIRDKDLPKLLNILEETYGIKYKENKKNFN